MFTINLFFCLGRRGLVLLLLNCSYFTVFVVLILYRVYRERMENLAVSCLSLMDVNRVHLLPLMLFNTFKK